MIEAASDNTADTESTESEPIVAAKATDSSLTSHSRTSASSATSLANLPLWYRSSIVRIASLVCFALLVLLNIFSLALDSHNDCELLIVFQILSTIVYGLLFTLLALAVPTYDKAAPSASSTLRLLFAVISAVCHIVLAGLAVLSCLSLLVDHSRCHQRVYFMFVTALDSATPLFACVFLCSYAVLRYVGQYRQKQDEGVDLSPLTPSASDLHLFYYALVTLVCLINVTAVVHHTSLVHRKHVDTDRLLSWISLIVQSSLAATLALALLAALLYRLSLSPPNQHRHLIATLSTTSPEVLTLAALLLLTWLLSVAVNAVLTFVFFVRDVHIGGLAVVGWLNHIVDVAGLVVLVREVRRHWVGVRQCGEVVWLTLKGEGMATGIYANESRVNVERSMRQSQSQRDVEVV